MASVGPVAAAMGASLPINPATHFDGDHKEEAAEALSAFGAEVLSIIFNEIMVSREVSLANVLLGRHTSLRADLSFLRRIIWSFHVEKS